MLTLCIFYIKKNLRWYYFIFRLKNLLQKLKCLKTTAFNISFIPFQGPWSYLGTYWNTIKVSAAVLLLTHSLQKKNWEGNTYLQSNMGTRKHKNVEKLKFPVIFVYFQGPSNYWRKYWETKRISVNSDV